MPANRMRPSPRRRPPSRASTAAGESSAIRILVNAPGEKPSMKRWSVALYMWLASNALSPARFYHLPPGRVVELGTQVTI